MGSLRVGDGARYPAPMAMNRGRQQKSALVKRLALLADTTAEIGDQEVSRPWAETYVAMSLAMLIAHFSNGSATTLAGAAAALLAVVGVDAVRRAEVRGLRPGGELILAGLVGLGGAGAIRLVPTGLALLIVIGITCLILRAVVEWEFRLRQAPGGATHRDRVAALAVSTFMLFGASLGAIALIPGVVTVPNTPSARPDPVGIFAILAVGIANAAMTALLAGRLAHLRDESRSAIVRDALGAAVLNGIASAAFATFGAARLAGPAGLAVLFYAREIWAETPAGERSDSRLVLEILFLVVATAAALLWIGVGR
jgi:hypothetical protein